MKRRMVIVALSLSVLTGVLIFSLLRRETNQPRRLEAVRQGNERGKPVVFFRIEGGGGKKVQISEAWIGNPTLGFEYRGIWAAWHPSVLDASIKVGQEFTVPAPDMPPVWRLRARLWTDERFSARRLKLMWENWLWLRGRGRPCLRAASETWNGFYGAYSQVIESELITNSVPPS